MQHCIYDVYVDILRFFFFVILSFLRINIILCLKKFRAAESRESFFFIIEKYDSNLLSCI